MSLNSNDMLEKEEIIEENHVTIKLNTPMQIVFKFCDNIHKQISNPFHIHTKRKKEKYMYT